ncbi:MAG: S-layer homology domain-containing protein, partial [Clostridia bacterium]|nr:S-layer homology domain-containing protein [Clostridia bacterium]
MKNLRRLLSLIVVLSMVLSFNVSVSQAAVFTDVPDTHKYAEAINLLSGLGIITGYGNGVFKPDHTVTRAEAATIIVRTLGMADDVEQGSTIFSDVKSSHWASGYINKAVENGIINGFPDGTFLPEDNVTYEQIVKMVVCAIGHDPKANELGGYPQGFIRAASDAKVTKGISGSGSNPAPRGLVAQLIYNALEVEMMDATSYSTGVLGISYTYNGKTLLRDYLEIEKVDAIVVDTYLTGETFSSRNKFVELEITDVYTLEKSASRALYDEGDIVEFDEGSFEAASNYLGRAITAYVGEDRDTRKDTIFAITVDSSRNDEVEVTKDKFHASGSDETVISYAKRVTDKRLTELELDRNVTVVVNGAIVNDAITEYFDDFDVMTLVDNNRDEEYDFVFVDVFDESEGVEFVVAEIEEDDDVYYFEGEEGELELDYEDDELLIKVIKDGKEVEAGAIEIGDTITCLDTSRSIITVYVSSDIVKGFIDEVDYSEGEYVINEEAYKLSPAFAEDLKAGDYGTFYLNYQGKIAYSTVASRVAGGDYVFIANYDTETKFSKTTYLVQAITEEGDVETYTLKSSKMKYVDHRGSMFKNVTPKEVYDYLTFNTTELSAAYGIAGYVGIARVKVSSAGVISEIYMPGSYEEFYEQTRYSSENSKEYNQKRGTYGNYDLDEDIVAFRVDDAEESLTDAVAAGTIGTFFTDGSSYSFVAYGERGEDIEAIVITDGISAANYEDHALIVTKVSTVRVNSETTTKITGRQGTSTVTYLIDPDENFDVEVGNIVLVSENAEGYVTKLEKVANTTDDADDLYNAFDGVDVPSDEEAGVFAGMVEDKSSKRFEIAGIEDGFYNGDNTAYHLIDYTLRETTFAKGSMSEIKLTSKVDTYVVVRTYEDEAVDVFIFRLDADEYDVPTTDIWDNIQSAEPEEDETEATTAPTEPETQAPTEATEATEATAAPTEATEATEATAAPTEATEATEATAAPTEATEATEA